MSRKSSRRTAGRSNRNLSQKSRSSLGRSLSRRSAYTRTLRLEPLEDRRLLAVVTVTTLSDTVDFNDGVTSLREAILATNMAPGADIIEFAPSLTAGGPAKILLTRGELTITNDLAIVGPGAALLTLDASGNDPTPDVDNGDGSRVFNFEFSFDDFQLAISGLTLTGGDVTGAGGAIRCQEGLTISDVRVLSNHATESGGGIYVSNGSFEATDCSVLENKSGRSGGGLALYVTHSDTISGCTISGNSTAGFGGGILSEDEMTITNSLITGNQATNSGGGLSSFGVLDMLSCNVTENTTTGSLAIGGGVYLNGRFGDVHQIRESVLSGNTTKGGKASGGGIAIRDTDLLLVSSTVRDNSTIGADAAGGGVYVGPFADATVTTSTVADNSAGGRGGGIANVGHDLTIDQSTITGNSSAVDGGGVLVGGHSLLVVDSTISGNEAARFGGGFYIGTTSTTFVGATFQLSTITLNQSNSGGGLFVLRGPLTLDGSILAGNDATIGPDMTGFLGAAIVAEFDLIGSSADSGFTPAPVGMPDAHGNIIGGKTTNLIDPRLAPLGENGGLTRTHALLAGSPAIDMGDPIAVAGVGNVPLDDQRDAPFVRIFGGRIDIGAVERQNFGRDLGLVVDTAVDELDGDLSPGDVSLREAIALANGNVDVLDTITFAPTLAGATLKLTLGELKISDSTTIQGLGANSLTIDASGNDPTTDQNNGDGSLVFDVDNSDADTLVDVTISGMTLTGGDSHYGGAVLSYENLTVSHSVITGNSSTMLGGGIGTIGGTLTLDHANISHNESTGYGGGIATYATTVTIAASTISGNTGKSGGGCYFYGGTAALSDSLISDNRTGGISGLGGGLDSRSTDLHVVGSRITGNSARQGGGVYSGGYLRLENCLVSGNSASNDGGGVLVRTKGKLLRSTIVDNRADRDGGGVWSEDTLSVTDSTVARNAAGRDGGGLRLEVVHLPVSLVQVTVSGNTSAGNGGGIWTSTLQNGSITIAHSTVAFNQALGTSLGGGVFVYQGEVDLDQTILATNVATTGPDITGLLGASIHSRYSLIGDNANSGLASSPGSGPDGNGNLIGGSTRGNIDPQLQPLAYNGGPTPTHAIAGPRAPFGQLSPAVDAGDPAAAAGMNGVPQFDQRGVSFARIVEGDNRDGTRIDIGAFEAQRINTFIVYGDYNRNGIADAADYTVWADALGKSVTAPYAGADGNGDGQVTWADYDVWKGNFGLRITSFGAAAELDGSEGSDEERGTIVSAAISSETLGGDISAVANSQSLLQRDASIGPIVVTTLSDTVDFNDGVTSLREAIFAANLVPGADTINFAPTLTAGGPAKILLTSGELAITDALTIDGPGANLLTIDAQQQSRIFNINDGSNANRLVVQISGLTLTAGKGYLGGAVYNDENLTLSQATIIGNSASRSGGGIASFGGSLSLDHVAVLQNSSTLTGGGITSYDTAVNISASTISGNSSATGAGGIYSRAGDLAIESCSLSSNSCKNGASAVLALLGDLTITDSTFTANTSLGATIHEYSGKLVLVDSIVSENMSNFSYIVYVNGGEAEISHVTFKNNTGRRGHSGGDSGVVVADRSSLLLSDCVISANEDLGGVSTSTGQTKIQNSTIDQNGGPGVSTRGELTRIDNCAITGNNGLGISAYSSDAASTIDIENSRIDGNHGGGANIGASLGGTVTFSNCSLSGNDASAPTPYGGPNFGGGLLINSAGPTLIRNCTIVGNTGKYVPNGWQSGASVGGILLFELATATTTVSGCTISGNSISGGYGGGISVVTRAASVGPTSITNCQISYNSSTNGGGLYVSGSDVTVSDSSIDHNFAAGDGGGIYESKFSSSRLQLRNSTISGDIANGTGGGLCINGPIEIGNTTIAENFSQTGGGVFISTSSLAAENTLVAGNSASFGPDITGYLGAKVALRYCFVGNSDASGLIEAPLGSPDANGNLIGGPVHGVIDAKLGPLTDNGGFTLPDGSHILTMAPLAGSPVIDRGDPNAVAGVNGAPASDQRGVRFTRVFNGRIDIGAVEYEPAWFLAGDYNHNGIVDAADYTVWRLFLGHKLSDVPAGLPGDGNWDDVVNQADFDIWKNNFGATLEEVASAEFGVASGVQGRMVEGGGDPVGVSASRLVGSGVGLSVNVGRIASRPALGALGTRSVASALKDEGLLAWLAEREGVRNAERGANVVPRRSIRPAYARDWGAEGEGAKVEESVDEVFAGVAVSV